MTLEETAWSQIGSGDETAAMDTPALAIDTPAPAKDTPAPAKDTPAPAATVTATETLTTLDYMTWSQ